MARAARAAGASENERPPRNTTAPTSPRPARSTPTPRAIGKRAPPSRRARTGRGSTLSAAARSAAARAGVGGVTAERAPDDPRPANPPASVGPMVGGVSDDDSDERRSPDGCDGCDGWLPMLVDQRARGWAFAWSPPVEPVTSA